MNTNASNSLMFLILGVLAGAMLIVMVFLVAICFVRQRKEKLRLLAQVNAGDKGEWLSGLSWILISSNIFVSLRLAYLLHLKCIKRISVEYLWKKMRTHLQLLVIIPHTASCI